MVGLPGRNLGFIDPSKVIVMIGGITIVGGWAKGEIASIKYGADQFGLTVGSTGDASRNKSNDMSAKISLKFLQTSPWNKYLMGLFLVDQVTGAAPVPFSLSDLANLEKFVAAAVWVTKVPDLSYSNEDVAREWQLETNYLDPMIAPIP